MPSIAQLEKQINDLEAKRLLKVGEYSELNAQVEKLKARSLELEVFIRKQTEMLRDRPKEVRQEIIELETKRDTLEKEDAKKREEAEKALSIYESRKGDLKKDIANLAKEKKTLQGAVLEATEGLKAIEKDLKSLKTSQTKEQAKLSGIKEKYAPLLEDYEKQIKAEEKKLKKLQKESVEISEREKKLALFYRRIKRYYHQAGLEWFEIKDLEHE